MPGHVSEHVQYSGHVVKKALHNWWIYKHYRASSETPC